MIGSLPAEFGGDGRGGVAVHTGQIARALVAGGEAVTVLANDCGKAVTRGSSTVAPFAIKCYTVPTKAEAVGLLMRSAPLPRVAARSPRPSLSWRQWLWMRVLARRYRDLIGELSPDIVHVHGAGLALLAVDRALAPIRLPLVVTMHSLRGHVPDTAFFGRSVPSLFVADALIAVSRHLKDEAISYGVDGSKIHVIPNGVDRAVFAPVPQEIARAKLALPPDARIVLLVAHLIERKGADIAINAMREVVSKFPNARLYLIGEAQSYTDPSWMQRLQHLPRELAIENEVIFVGDIPGHSDGRLNLWYNAADVLILPSRAEGMGMVLTEAMACGTPVIGARVGGIPNVISDGSNGLLVPPEEPAALARAVMEVLGNRELRGRLAAEGVRYVEREHDWERIAARTREVYTEARKIGSNHHE